MKFEEVFDISRTHLNSKAKNSEEVIRELTSMIPNVDRNEIEELVAEREEQISTGIGNAIAIPHCRYAKTKQLIGSILKLKDPIDFGAIDKEKVRLFFLIVGNPHDVKEHVRLLGKIGRIGKNIDSLQTLFEEDNPEKFMKYLFQFEEE